MRIVVKRIPIEIIELGIETYAQIDIEEILLISYPPITKTVLKFYTEYIAFEFQKEYSVKIKSPLTISGGFVRIINAFDAEFHIMS